MALRGGTSYRAGDEVDDRCARCKLDLAHTVLAVDGTRIARVRCNTCGSDHKYRGPQTASEAKGSRSRTVKRAQEAAALKTKTAPSEFETLIRGKDLSQAQKYSPRMELAVDSVVDHPNFGIGLVTEIKDGGKAHIAFPSGGRILVFGRG